MHAGRRQRLIGNSITDQHEGKGQGKEIHSTNTMVHSTHTHEGSSSISMPHLCPTQPPLRSPEGPIMNPAPVWYHSDIHRNLQNVDS